MTAGDKQNTLGPDFTPDPARYRRASEPHESPEAADQALQAFCDELSELRVKHRIRDLYVVYGVSLFEEDGSESTATGSTEPGPPPPPPTKDSDDD